MCILLKPDVVISNAFFARKGINQPFLKISALRNFCNIVYDEITRSNQVENQYKYVYFQVDEDDVDEFCNMDNRFIKGIDKVYKTMEVEYEEVERINSIYAKEIQISLEVARKEFAKIEIN